MKLLPVAVLVLTVIAVVHADPVEPKKVTISIILDQCAEILKSLPRAIQRFIVESIARIGGIKIEAIIQIVEAIRNFLGTLDGVVEMTGSVIIHKLRYLLDIILKIVAGIHYKSS